MWGILWLCEGLSGSQEGLCLLEFVIYLVSHWCFTLLSKIEMYSFMSAYPEQSQCLCILIKHFGVSRIFLQATKFAYSLTFLPFRNILCGLPNSCGSLYRNVDGGHSNTFYNNCNVCTNTWKILYFLMLTSSKNPGLRGWGQIYGFFLPPGTHAATLNHCFCYIYLECQPTVCCWRLSRQMCSLANLEFNYSPLQHDKLLSD
jgi:hypothetical protein